MSPEESRLFGGGWLRGRKIELRGADLYCQLAVDRPYNLAESYSKGPHIQFLNCESDLEIQNFVRAWGPLYLRRGRECDEFQLGVTIRPLEDYRVHRRWLKAVKGLVDAAKGILDQRDSLIEFLNADLAMDQANPAYQPEIIPFSHLALQLQYCGQRDVISWVGTCDPSLVRLALANCIEAEVRAPAPGLQVSIFKNKLKIAPRYTLHSLWEALMWMLWFDEWNANPSLACPACLKIFRPLTQHKRKYCSQSCAHRFAVRNWRERKRKKTSLTLPS